MTQSLSLKRWDMANIKFKADENKGPVIVLIGRRDTGKSFLVQDLLYFHRDVPIGTVISGTEAGNGFYQPIIPKMFIHHEYSNTIIENILRRQMFMVKKHNREKIESGRSSIDGRTFVILDDCLYDDKWTRDKLMRMLFMNGRHWKVMLIITMQYPLGIPPVLRTNIDYVFILREPIGTNRKRIFDNYASMFPTFESFCTVMDQTTANYECLVIDNNSKETNLTDMVFWYKAVKRPNYRLTLKEYWDIAAQMADNSDDEGAEFDPASIRKKSAGPMLSVRKMD